MTSSPYDIGKEDVFSCESDFSPPAVKPDDKSPFDLTTTTEVLTPQFPSQTISLPQQLSPEAFEPPVLSSSLHNTDYVAFSSQSSPSTASSSLTATEVPSSPIAVTHPEPLSRNEDSTDSEFEDVPTSFPQDSYFANFSIPPGTISRSGVPCLPSFGYVYADLEWRYRWTAMRIAQLEKEEESIKSKLSSMASSDLISPLPVNFPHSIPKSSLSTHPLLSLQSNAANESGTPIGFTPHPLVSCLSSCAGFSNFYSEPPIRLPFLLTEQQPILKKMKEEKKKIKEAKESAEKMKNITDSSIETDSKAVRISNGDVATPHASTTNLFTSSTPCIDSVIETPSFRLASPLIPADFDYSVLDKLDGYDSSDEMYINLHQSMQQFMRQQEVQMDRNITSELKHLKKIRYAGNRSRSRLSSGKVLPSNLLAALTPEPILEPCLLVDPQSSVFTSPPIKRMRTEEVKPLVLKRSRSSMSSDPPSEKSRVVLKLKKQQRLVVS
ncbi:hypothetical protein RCL1_001661 [Eukaryota sp. TZLM3-RCL]